MNPKSLDGVFPPGELCLVEITNDENIEASSDALAFTDGGVIVSGTWEVHVVQDGIVDPIRVVGARFIPWRRVVGISAQCEVEGYATREDLAQELELYGVPEDERPEVLAGYDAERGTGRKIERESASNWREAGRRTPATSGAGR